MTYRKTVGSFTLDFTTTHLGCLVQINKPGEYGATGGYAQNWDSAILSAVENIYAFDEVPREDVDELAAELYSHGYLGDYEVLRDPTLPMIKFGKFTYIG